MLLLFSVNLKIYSCQIIDVVFKIVKVSIIIQGILKIK